MKIINCLCFDGTILSVTSDKPSVDLLQDCIPIQHVNQPTNPRFKYFRFSAQNWET